MGTSPFSLMDYVEKREYSGKLRKYATAYFGGDCEQAIFYLITQGGRKALKPFWDDLRPDDVVFAVALLNLTALRCCENQEERSAIIRAGKEAFYIGISIPATIVLSGYSDLETRIQWAVHYRRIKKRMKALSVQAKETGGIAASTPATVEEIRWYCQDFDSACRLKNVVR